mgnify:CR=1 FL=1
MVKVNNVAYYLFGYFITLSDFIAKAGQVALCFCQMLTQVLASGFPQLQQIVFFGRGQWDDDIFGAAKT